MAGVWKKSSAKLVEMFDRAVGEFPDIERRKMFGYPCAFLGGHMVTGLHEENWIVRLSAGDREQLLAQGGTTFAPMGRAMTEYVVMPVEVRRNPQTLHAWLEKSLAYVRALPPKKPKRPKRSNS